MKRFFPLLLLLAFALVGCRSSHMKEGDESYQQGKYKKAVNHYDKHLEKEPKSYRARLKKASAYERMGQTDRALAAYSTLIKKYPKKATPRLYRARLLYSTNDDPAALRDADRIINHYPNVSPHYKTLAYSLQGEIYYDQGNMKRSSQAFENAYALGGQDQEFKTTPHYRRLMHNLGRVQFALGNFRRAKKYFGRYLDKKKANGLPIQESDHYFYALILKYTGNFAEAEKYEAKLSMENRRRLSQESRQ